MARVPELDPGKISMSLDEAALATGVSRRTIYEWIRLETLQSFKLGGRRLILRTDLERFITDAARGDHQHAA
jgi:excisionase family DNA binding protein